MKDYKIFIRHILDEIDVIDNTREDYRILCL